MAILKRIDGNKFSIDGREVYKGTIELRAEAFGIYFTLYENGQILRQYERLLYSDFVNDDEGLGDAFGSPEELVQYAEEVFNVYLPYSRPYKALSSASANFSMVKPGQALLHSLTAINTSEQVRYLKIYDTGSLPNGTDVPVLTFPLYNKAVKEAVSLIPGTLKLNNGLAYSITSGIEDTSEDPIGVNEVVINMIYQ